MTSSMTEELCKLFTQSMQANMMVAASHHMKQCIMGAPSENRGLAANEPKVEAFNDVPMVDVKQPNAPETASILTDEATPLPERDRKLHPEVALL